MGFGAGATAGVLGVRKAGRGMALALAVALYWSAMAMIALAARALLPGALALQRWRA